MKNSLDQMKYELTMGKGGDVSPEERQKNLEAFLKDSKVKQIGRAHV